MFSHPQKGMPKDDVARFRKEGGLWLKAMREQAGLSQKELASKLGSEYYSFVSQLEGGKGRVPVAKMELWAEVLGVPPPEFAKGILRFYDPLTYRMLFGDEPFVASTLKPRRRPAAPSPLPAPSDANLVARLNRIEALLMLKGVGS